MGQCASASSSGGKGLVHTERTGADFFAQPVFSADAEVESMRRGIGHLMLIRSGGAYVSHKGEKNEGREGSGEGG